MSADQFALSAIGLGLALGVLGTVGLEEVRWRWWAWRWARVGRRGLTRQDWNREREGVSDD